MKVLILTIVWLAVIWLFRTVHRYIIVEKHKSPYHGISAACVLALAVLFSCLMYQDWFFRGVAVVFLCLMYWILFNLLLNKAIGRDPLYLGDSSILDRLEKKFKNPAATLGLKVVLLIICVFILLDLPNPWL